MDLRKVSTQSTRPTDTESMENDISTTKSKIINFMEKSEKYIWMSSGFNSKFYNDIEIKHSILKALKRVKEMKVIIDGDVKTKKSELSWLFECKREFDLKMQIRQQDDILHWIIIDGRHYRLEKQHNSRFGTSNLFVENITLDISEELKKEFNRWWDEAKPVDLSVLI